MVKETVEKILSGNEFTLEHIVSRGDVSPEGFWYEDSRCEWVMVVEGCGELEFSDGTRLMLEKGDSYVIESMKKHRVSYTSEDCVWIALYYTK